MKPHALVTNDDGIDSIFLHRLVDALLPDFRVSVAAPAFEQSWIGRAVSRHREVEVLQSPALFPEGVDAWAISGTPTDCVNIALGNLVQGPVDIVLSGINIGFNTTETLILSSGTVAGASSLHSRPMASSCDSDANQAVRAPVGTLTRVPCGTC